MTYEKQEWEDFAEGNTPLSAQRLNHMEDGIAQAGRFYGWAQYPPPSFPPDSDEDDTSYEQWSAADALVRQGESIWTLTPAANSFSDSLTSQSENGWNPGPTFDQTAGPDGGPALLFYPSPAKGAENQFLRSDMGGNNDSNLSIIFVPPAGNYMVLIPGALTPESLYFAGQVDGEFFVSNGNNTVAYTSDALEPGVPHLLTLVFREFVRDELDENWIEGSSRIMLDGLDIVEPGQLWVDPNTNYAEAMLVISNVVPEGEEPLVFLWVAVWGLPTGQSDNYYLDSISSYARTIGCPLPPLGED